MIGLIVLVLLCGGVSAGSHSIHIFITFMTPIPGVPDFVAVMYLDEIQLVVYDSDRKKLITRDQWMMDVQGPLSWEQLSQLMLEGEHGLKADIPYFMSLNGQSEGIHVDQLRAGCELKDNGNTSEFLQIGWDGQDMMSFDLDKAEWVAQAPWAHAVQDNWNQNMANKQRWNYYLKNICIHWLKFCLQYKDQVLRPIAPIVYFTRLGDSNRLSCIVTGFYPPDIEVTLWRDGVLIDETLSSGILPNHNSTFQIRKWTEFDPEDQAEYSCRVEHRALRETMEVIYGPQSDSQVPAVVGIVLGIVLVIGLIILAFFIYKKRVASHVPTGTPGTSAY
ncbi:major histocompatibility complex class I-related gene protein-like [Heterodontus francisci]|uniref:major histocompatibility complex class I-related gene protein-like n=1 Tax=Heterodontus francisci TaxID=7792 RepID=UPI00355C2947